MSIPDLCDICAVIHPQNLSKSCSIKKKLYKLIPPNKRKFLIGKNGGCTDFFESTRLLNRQKRSPHNSHNGNILFDWKISLASGDNNITQQTTLEGISRDRGHGLTYSKDQYFQDNFDTCVAGAKYFGWIVFTNWLCRRNF